MIYIVINALGEQIVFDGNLNTNAEAQANLYLQQVREEVLQREAVRFQIAKTVIEGNDTTWSNADIENDPNTGVYQVFDHTTGRYTECLSLESAIALNQEQKEMFLQSIGLNSVLIFEELPKIIQPSSSGLQDIGG